MISLTKILAAKWLVLICLIVFISCQKSSEPDTPVNQPPNANAGNDTTLYLPANAAALFGSASNDPDGTISAWSWTKISGPSSFAIVNANLAQTFATNLVGGDYQFELKVTDSGGSSDRDTVRVTVKVPIVPINNAPGIEWEKRLGGGGSEEAFSIQLTADGGYIVAGYTGSSSGDVSGNHGSYDFWVVKLNGSGAIQWQKCLGGSGEDGAYSIQPTADGGYIVAGDSHSNDGDVSGNHGGTIDAWVVKLSSSGDIQWQKCLGGSGTDVAYSIQTTADGGYMVAGMTNSNDGDVSGNHGVFDAWVVKLTSNGSVQWQKCIGGLAGEDARSIQPTSDGGYIVAGSTGSLSGDVAGNHGNIDLWVVKINSNGAIQWQKCLGGSGVDNGYAIRTTTDGGYIVTGYTGSSDGDVSGTYGNLDMWVVKINSSGTIQWQKRLGGSGEDIGYSIQTTSDGGYIVAGRTDSYDQDILGNLGGKDAWVVRLNSSGVIQWRRCLGGPDWNAAYSIQSTADGGSIIAGMGGTEQMTYTYELIVKLKP